MEIFGTFTKRAKKGKNLNGSQRWEIKEYVIHSCKRCGEQCTSRLIKGNFHPLCRKCSRTSQESRDNSLLYTQEVEKYYGDTYIVEQKEFAILKDSILMTCKEHNITKSARISDLLYSIKRYGKEKVPGPCSECQRLNRKIFTCEKGKEDYLYRLYYIYFPDIKMYKLGISSQKELSNRTYGKPFNLIWEKRFTYKLCREIENEVHKYFKDKRYVGKEKLIRDGNTELYTENILPSIAHLTCLTLSSDFKEKSLI